MMDNHKQVSSKCWIFKKYGICYIVTIDNIEITVSTKFTTLLISKVIQEENK